MSVQIDANLVKAYSANVELGLQQKKSRLVQFCRQEKQTGEVDFYDRVTATTAVKLTSRHSPTPIIQTPHDRRKVTVAPYVWADLIDKQDKAQMLYDPASIYIQNGVAALVRGQDDAIISAFTATAYSGKDGSTTVAFPSANIVSVSYKEGGGGSNANLIVDKVRSAKKILTSAEAYDEGDELVFVLGSSQIQALLSSTVVGSVDYNSVKPLVDGDLARWMGFNFVRSERLPVASSIRKCFAFVARKGMLFASSFGVESRIDNRPDLNHAAQPYASAMYGATRMWEEMVVEVDCDETNW